MEPVKLVRERETLFIPLLGKAMMSARGLILRDKKAEEIVSSVDYDFSRTDNNRFIAIYMAIRAAILDDYANAFIAEHPDAAVIHLGCGLDSRVTRLNKRPKMFYDLDFPEVIEARRAFYSEDEGYKMIASSAVDFSWLDQVETGGAPVLVIAEGMTMYLTGDEMRALVLAMQAKFGRYTFAFDAYNVWAVKVSARKNPVNKMGAKIRWGLDDPADIEAYGPGILHVGTRLFTDYPRVNDLKGMTKFLFRILYGNAWADKLYKIYFFDVQS